MQLGKCEKAIIQGFFTELGIFSSSDETQCHIIFSSSDEAQCHIIFSLWTVSSVYEPLGIIKDKNPKIAVHYVGSPGTNTIKLFLK